jgi:hypothetical protein
MGMKGNGFLVPPCITWLSSSIFRNSILLNNVLLSNVPGFLECISLAKTSSKAGNSFNVVS